MRIDNRLRTAKLKIAYLLMFGFILALSLYYYFENLNDMVYPIIIGVVVLIYILLLVRRSNYFFMEYLGSKIIVRYYIAHPIFRKYKAFEFSRSYFFGYKIKSSFFGFFKTLQLTVKTPQGRFNYPPLSISLLSNEQMNDLVKMLDELKN